MYHVGMVYARTKCLDPYKEIRTSIFLLNYNESLNVRTNAHAPGVWQFTLLNSVSSNT